MSREFNGSDWAKLHDHVAPFDATEPGYVSTFNAAVREARTLTARDLQTGDLSGGQPIALWAGSAVYLILLEQVGRSLRPKGAPRTRKMGENNVEKALRQFAPDAATARQRQVLYALRCAFVHEFGLFNNNAKSLGYQHVFALDDARGGPLVTWPRHRWDGNVSTAGPRTSTTVNLPAMGNVAEAVVRSVRIRSATMTLRPQFQVDELQKRFGFTLIGREDHPTV